MRFDCSMLVRGRREPTFCPIDHPAASGFPSRYHAVSSFYFESERNGVNCELGYDDGSFVIELPERGGICIVGNRFPAALPDPVRDLRSALGRPIDSSPLGEMIAGSGRISVLISDITRGSACQSVLGPLLSFLEENGAGPDRVEIILAMGMHRGHSGPELARHLGEDIAARWTVSEHDARDNESMVYVGDTTSGTPCRYNERVVTSTLVICLGSISFHYFAGFGGGRKLLLPGVAAADTILANHRLSLREDPGEGLADGCAPGNLDGNPVHEDMLEGVSLLPPPVFAINTIFDAEGSLSFVNAGSLVESHRSACAALLSSFLIPLDHRYRLVIVSAGGDPKDINLLQSHKAIRHASYALREGGTMLVAAACREGVGSPSYREAFAGGRIDVPDAVRREYTLNAQTAMSTFELTGRFDIRLQTMLTDQEVTRFGFVPWQGEDTVKLVDAVPHDEILVIMNGSVFLPCVNGEH